MLPSSYMVWFSLFVFTHQIKFKLLQMPFTKRVHEVLFRRRTSIQDEFWTLYLHFFPLTCLTKRVHSVDPRSTKKTDVSQTGHLLFTCNWFIWSSKAYGQRHNARSFKRKALQHIKTALHLCKVYLGVTLVTMRAPLQMRTSPKTHACTK